jgi:hypothetical protein
MGYWDQVLGVASNSGLYCATRCFDEAALDAAASEAGLKLTAVALERTRAKADLLASLSTALQFPSYFGLNWDALNDSLTDLTWKAAAGYVVLCRGLRTWLDANPTDGRTAVSVFQSAAEHWRQRNVPFYIILS